MPIAPAPGLFHSQLTGGAATPHTLMELYGEKIMDKEAITLWTSVIALLGSLPAKQEKLG